MSDPTFSRSSINQYIVFNQNYNVLPVKIRLKGASDPGVINLNPGQQIVVGIQYNGNLAKFYYNNAVVQMIDLNNGASSDDLNAPNCDNNSYNTLRYNEGSPQGGLDVVNFDSCTYKARFDDQDGIAGGHRAAFVQTIEGSAIKVAVRLAEA
ncbi:hypothetical protein [Nannocystis pusilla]|uniref:hypothetical protein n=1 Tax=Nannocystis pusilla TaxID=889268 RepID=UPI003B7FBDD0